MPGKTLKNKLPENIRATFSGRGLDLINVSLSRKSSFKFVLDLQRIEFFYDFPMNEYFENNPEKVVYPSRTQIRFLQIIWPDTLHIELDRLMQVRIPVIPDVNIETSPGYILSGVPVLIPDSVSLSGPRTNVRNYKNIRTEAYNAKGVYNPIKVQLHLLIPEMENIEISNHEVNYFQAVEQIGEITVENIPVEILNTPVGSRIEISPSTVSLTVSGAISVLKCLQITDFKIFFDFNKGWQPGQLTYTPVVELPAGVINWSEMVPRRIEVRVVREMNF
jgi:hypothetical protein